MSIRSLAAIVGVALGGGVAPAEEPATIVLEPGKTRAFKPQTVLYTGARRSPRVGDRKKQQSLQGLAVTPVGGPATISTIDDLGKKREVGVKATASRGAIRIKASPEAAGREYLLSLDFKADVWRYTESRRIDGTGRERKTTSWVKVAPEFYTQKIRLLVDLDDFPTILVPIGGRLKLAVSEIAKITHVGRPRRPTSAVDVTDHALTVHGLEAAKETFRVTYVLGGKKVLKRLKVEVIEKPFALAVKIADPSKPRDVSLDEVGKLIELRDVKVVRVDGFEPTIARVERIEGAVRVAAAGTGRTTARMVVEALERKSRSPERFLTSVRVEIDTGSSG